jgi:pathogenesis-related protein 1
MTTHSFVIPLLALLAFTAPASCRLAANQPSVNQPSAGQPAASPSPAGPASAATPAPPAYAQALVNAHNRYRAEVGAPALVWDDRLAAYAQAWADRLAKRPGQLAHRSGKDAKEGYGENLAYRWWSGTRPSNYTPEGIMAQWGEEKSYYQPGKPYPNCCRGGECGHYTQIIWAKTQRVGCGMVEYSHKGGKGEVWVCNYDPPGNWLNQSPTAK